MYGTRGVPLDMDQMPKLHLLLALFDPSIAVMLFPSIAATCAAPSG